MTTTTVDLRMVAGYQQILEELPSTQLVLHTNATFAAAHARSIAPVVSGDYRDSIEAEGPDLVATDFKAHWIEFGTVRTRAQAVLRTAARLFCTRLRES
jgi:O-succinylbenzoate synthase